MLNRLFTTPACPNCPRAKEVLDQNHISYEVVDAGSPGGLSKARMLGVQHVPSLIIFDQEDHIVARYHGLEAIIHEFLCSSPDSSR